MATHGHARDSRFLWSLVAALEPSVRSVQQRRSPQSKRPSLASGLLRRGRFRFTTRLVLKRVL